MYISVLKPNGDRVQTKQMHDGTERESDSKIVNYWAVRIKVPNQQILMKDDAVDKISIRLFLDLFRPLDGPATLPSIFRKQFD